MKSPGQIAFEAWCTATADQVPKHNVTWERLRPTTQTAWHHVADAVIAYTADPKPKPRAAEADHYGVPTWAGLGK